MPQERWVLAALRILTLFDLKALSVFVAVCVLLQLLLVCMHLDKFDASDISKEFVVTDSVYSFMSVCWPVVTTSVKML